MAVLHKLYAGGGAADMVLLALAAEFVVLAMTRHGWRAVAAALLPGALIVVALRAALIGADWRWIALPLALSLPAHVADLKCRGWLGRHRWTRRRVEPELKRGIDVTVGAMHGEVNG